MTTTDVNAITAWFGPPPAGTGADPFAANPLADKLEAADYVAFAQALANNGPTPKLFENGLNHLPNRTRSGIDPVFIGLLPVGVRHHACDLKTEAEVHRLFEQVAGTPDVVIDHPGLRAAAARLTAWSTGQLTNTTARAVTTTPARAPQTARRLRAMATVRTTSHTPDELIAMGRRGEFLPPKSTRPRPAPVSRQRTRTGRSV